jgi:hypothetical protein
MMTASEMTDEELEACIRELDAQFRPIIDLKPVEVHKPLSFAK